MEMNDLAHLHLDYEAPQMQVVAVALHNVILGGSIEDMNPDGPELGG